VTYSIVARDSETGQLGVAVQSRWFSVARIVAWAEPGIGAVATQSFAEPAYGPRGLELMRHGLAAPEALRALVAVDGGEAVRQVAMVDAGGSTAAHTGSGCVPACGHREAPEVSAQANMMERDTAWNAMVDAYSGASGELADRLLAALDAAEAEGGDIRGRQSAALLVVAGQPTGNPGTDVLVDLRVEDTRAPLPELRRLLKRQRAYDGMSRATTRAREGELDAALLDAALALEEFPDDDQLAFWCGLMLAGAGRIDEAAPLLAQAGKANARWSQFPARLASAGVIPNDPDLIAEVERALEGLSKNPVTSGDGA
jgi:uncharacterized Ntn-hydrolase superfamily protein